LISGEEIGKMILNKNYSCNNLKDLLNTKEKHKRLINFLIRHRKSRRLIFYFGILLLNIPYFKNKAISLLV